MDRSEVIEKHSDIVFKWLKDNQLHNTMENIRRYYSLKYGKLPSEKGINEIYEYIEKYIICK